MDSKILNDKIREFEGNTTYYEAFGGKAVPYIGWFWRNVNFDADHCWFGIVPPYENTLVLNDRMRVGFMQRNKWDYDEIRCEGDDWSEIKRLLVVAVTEPSRETLGAVDDKIQSLLPEGYVYPEWFNEDAPNNERIAELEKALHAIAERTYAYAVCDPGTCDECELLNRISQFAHAVLHGESRERDCYFPKLPLRQLPPDCGERKDDGYDVSYV